MVLLDQKFRTQKCKCPVINVSGHQCGVVLLSLFGLHEALRAPFFRSRLDATRRITHWPIPGSSPRGSMDHHHLPSANANRAEINKNARAETRCPVPIPIHARFGWNACCLLLRSYSARTAEHCTSSFLGARRSGNAPPSDHRRRPKLLSPVGEMCLVGCMHVAGTRLMSYAALALEEANGEFALARVQGRTVPSLEWLVPTGKCRSESTFCFFSLLFLSPVQAVPST